MPFEPSEIVNLVLLITLAPLVLMAVRRVLPVTPKSVYVAVAAMSGAYVFTILEGFAFTDLFNLVEHSCLAVAGVAFLVCVVQVRRVLAEEAAR
jgi:hypothetical protein